MYRGFKINDKLSQNDLTRYQRQIKIKDFGNKSQIILKHSKVTVFGCGGLGCPTATYLAASGVGTLNLVDFQKPELSNLNRQIMHFEEDLNNNFKAFSLKDKLQKLNSSIQINAFTERIDHKSIAKFKDSDIFVDCLDNVTTRYIINNFSIKEKIPIVHAGVNSFYGQLTTIIPDCTPCLNCIFPENLMNIEGPPIIGSTCGTMGSLQSIETIKLLTSIGEPLVGRMLFMNLKSMEFETMKIRKRKDCNSCK